MWGDNSVGYRQEQDTKWGALWALGLPTFDGRWLTQPGVVGIGVKEMEPEPSEEKIKMDRETPPFIVSGALPVVPEKLVKKILNGKFVDMTELLRDNIKLEKRQTETAESAGGVPADRRSLTY